MNNFVDMYCERMGPGLLNEPVNAVTNVTFVIAALLIVRLAQKEKALDWRVGLLAGLIAIIGVGSALFHTFATTWAMLADSIPILFYQIAFLALYARYVMKLGNGGTVGILAVFAVTLIGAYQLPHDLLNGSIGYAPALVFIIILGFYHWISEKKEPYILLFASAIFLISLMFRTLDQDFCHMFPIGLHYMWHILNALVLYLSVKSYIANTAKA